MTLLNASGLRQRAADSLYTADTVRYEPVELTFLPYFAWGNRAPGDMRVWIREK